MRLTGALGKLDWRQTCTQLDRFALMEQRYLSPEEAAAYLGGKLTPKALEMLARRNPAIKRSVRHLGRLIRYDRHSLDQALEGALEGASQ